MATCSTVRMATWVLAIAFPVLAACRAASGEALAGVGPHDSPSHSHHPAGEHHEHGDADDQHDYPGSPCHHHDDHCCHSSPGDGSIGGADLSRTALPRAECATKIRDRVTILPILARELFRPPIA